MKTFSPRLLRNLLLPLPFTICLSSIPTIASADHFPDRPIRIIVYTGPGGLIDFTARKFADVARKFSPGQPIVVINKPGAGGIIAFDEVLQQPADGYHVLAVTRSNITKIVSAGREDLIESTDWFAGLMYNPHVVITNQKSGLNNWDAVVRDAQSRNGRQIWLGVDIGGVKHVSGLQVWEKTGISARWIPYGSGGQAAAALLGEIGQVYFGNPSDASGNPSLGVIAVCAAERLPAFPDTPTFAELGVPGLEKELIWRGFAFRKGTPEPILRWYDDLIRKVDADPEWRSQWEREGINVRYQPAAEFQALVAADQALFRQTLAPLGLLKVPNDQRWLGLEPATAVHLGILLFTSLLLGGAFAIFRSPRRNRLAEVSVSAGAVLVATAFLLMTSLLPPPNAIDQVGAAGVPRLWSIALLLLAGVQLILSLCRAPSSIAPRPPSSAPVSLPGHLFPAFATSVLAYLLLISFLGYYLATVIFLPAVVFLLGFRKWLPVIAITLCWLSFAYFVFQRALYVDLPGGWLMRQITG